MNITGTRSLSDYVQTKLKLVPDSDPVLHTSARDVRPDDDAISDVFSKMETVMSDSGGCGLAAPQVGIPYRMMLVDVGQGPIRMANPEITERSGKIPSLEGCLSLKGTMSLVMRSSQVTVEALDDQGKPFKTKCSGFKALAMQHELDHLNGTLMTDKAVATVTPARFVAGLAGFAAGAALRGTTGALIGGALGVTGAWGVEKLLAS